MLLHLVLIRKDDMLIHEVKLFCLPIQVTQACAVIFVPSFFTSFFLVGSIKFRICEVIVTS